MISRETLARVLSLGPVTVTFTKVDGAERVMRCTIAPYLIPENKRPKHSGEILTEVPGDVMRVFDVEQDDWRSFRVSSVKNFTTESEESSPQRMLLG